MPHAGLPCSYHLSRPHDIKKESAEDLRVVLARLNAPVHALLVALAPFLHRFVRFSSHSTLLCDAADESMQTWMA